VQRTVVPVGEPSTSAGIRIGVWLTLGVQEESGQTGDCWTRRVLLQKRNGPRRHEQRQLALNAAAEREQCKAEKQGTE
jgi:hypothetical protein